MYALADSRPQLAGLALIGGVFVAFAVFLGWGETLDDAAISFADAELGRLLEAVRNRGVGDDLVTIVTADHGEARGEHEELTHGVFLYRGAMRVPLVVAQDAVARLADAALLDLVRRAVLDDEPQEGEVEHAPDRLEGVVDPERVKPRRRFVVDLVQNDPDVPPGDVRDGQVPEVR